MQEWEYLTAEYNFDNRYIKLINDDYQKVHYPDLFSSKIVGLTLGQLLNKAGNEGWEVVACNTSFTGANGNVNDMLIILKRPKEQLEPKKNVLKA